MVVCTARSALLDGRPDALVIATMYLMDNVNIVAYNTVGRQTRRLMLLMMLKLCFFATVIDWADDERKPIQQYSP